MSFSWSGSSIAYLPFPSAYGGRTKIAIAIASGGATAYTAARS